MHQYSSSFAARFEIITPNNAAEEKTAVNDQKAILISPSRNEMKAVPDAVKKTLTKTIIVGILTFIASIIHNKTACYILITGTNNFTISIITYDQEKRDLVSL